MTRPLRSLFTLLALGAPLLAAACGGTAEDSADAVDEGALATAGKTIVRGLEHPSGLIVTDKHVYFSTNRFIASGEPELDQQFAYWEGKFSRVPLAGGAREKLDESPISRVRRSGKKLFMATGSSCWISVLDTAAAHPEAKVIYTDEDCTGEGGGEPTAFEATDTKFIVVRENGDVRVGKLDGTAMKKVAEFKFSNYAGFVSAEVLADDKIFVVTYAGFKDAHDKIMPQTIFSVPTSGGTPKTVKEFPVGQRSIENFVSDGKNLYFTQDQKLFILAAGSNEPKQVDEGFGQIVDLAADGTNVYVADGKRNAIYVVKDAVTNAVPHKKLGDAKGVSSLAVADGKLYYGTHAVDGRKAVGIVGAIDLQ